MKIKDLPEGQTSHSFEVNKPCVGIMVKITGKLSEIDFLNDEFGKIKATLHTPNDQIVTFPTVSLKDELEFSTLAEGVIAIKSDGTGESEINTAYGFVQLSLEDNFPFDNKNWLDVTLTDLSDALKYDFETMELQSNSNEYIKIVKQSINGAQTQERIDVLDADTIAFDPELVSEVTLHYANQKTVTKSVDLLRLEMALANDAVKFVSTDEKDRVTSAFHKKLFVSTDDMTHIEITTSGTVEVKKYLIKELVTKNNIIA